MVNFDMSKDIPSLTGRVIIVTGGTDGLGKESVYQLSRGNPAHIYLAARNKSKSARAISEVQSRNPTSCPITFLELDLTSFASIKSAAATFLASNTRLDILMCNAGVVGAGGTTHEGYETTFGVNHVGHALLINLLLPVLQQTAKHQPPRSVRVVILSSAAEAMAPKNYYFLAPDEAKSELPALSAMAKYAHSKIANTHYASQLAKHYPVAEYGVVFVSVHPGAVFTNLGNEFMSSWPMVMTTVRRVVGFFIRMVPVEKGVENQVWAAVGEGVEDGVYYHPVGLKGKGSSRVEDEVKADELWVWTQKELEGHTTL